MVVEELNEVFCQGYRACYRDIEFVYPIGDWNDSTVTLWQNTQISPLVEGDDVNDLDVEGWLESTMWWLAKGIAETFDSVVYD